MKINKFFVVLVAAIISILGVGCYKDPAKENSEIPNKTELFSVVELNTVQGICEYYLDALDVTPRIEPSTITENSSYYEVKNDNNTYIDALIGIKNLNNEVKMAEEILTAKIKINNNEYTCFSVAESTDNCDLEKDPLIKPLERRQIHYVAEVPKTDASGKIEIILTIDGKNFSNEFNLEEIR